MTVARDTAGRPKPIPVVVVGAAGKMGREVVRAIANARGMELAGAIDIRCIGADAGAPLINAPFPPRSASWRWCSPPPRSLSLPASSCAH
jgi:hypothetical protein